MAGSSHFIGHPERENYVLRSVEPASWMDVAESAVIRVVVGGGLQRAAAAAAVDNEMARMPRNARYVSGAQANRSLLFTCQLNPK